MANTYLSKAVSTTGNRRTWTFSAWVKRANVSTSAFNIMTVRSGNEQEWISFDGNSIHVSRYNNSYTYRYITNRLFRDTNSWYHVVVAMDSEQSTASNRMKLYVNGVQETSFSTETQIAEDYNTSWNTSGFTNYIGNEGNNQNYFDGSLSHVHLIDGTAYDASAFGSTDATTGEWVGKTSPSVTYGTNGFFILKDGNGITDQSGEGNDFTLGGGTLTDLKDNPDNIFATWNSLAQTLSGISYSSGNTVATMTGDVGQRESISTLGMDSGKFYMECKLQAIGSTGGSYPYIGIVAQEKYDADLYIGGNGCGWHPTGDIYNGGSNSSTGSTYTTGDIIGVAVDVTNSKLYWHKNGTYITIGGNVQNPSTGSYGFDISARTAEGTLGFGVSSWNNNGIWQVNFGNGFFGTTAITTNSGNGYSGAEGSSKFNYTVPTGYSALSTKGLNE